MILMLFECLTSMKSVGHLIKKFLGSPHGEKFFSKDSDREMARSELSYKHRLNMMPVVSADGEEKPLLVVIKGTRIPYRTVIREWVTYLETPVINLLWGAVIATRQDNGDVDSANFHAWGGKFVSYLQDLLANWRKCVLIYDAYRAHISVQVLELFHAKQIIFYTFRAHISEKTQPLSTVAFAAFKSHLNRIAAEVTLADGNINIDIFSFTCILKEAYHCTFTKEVIIAGVLRTGL